MLHYSVKRTDILIYAYRNRKLSTQKILDMTWNNRISNKFILIFLFLLLLCRMLANDWMAHYEQITDMIVPRSSTLITQDNDYCLYNVTLFKKVVEEFKLHAREKKFIVRDFVYNEEELAAGKNERTKLITDKKKQFVSILNFFCNNSITISTICFFFFVKGPLVRWLKVNFSEAFCALIHVKALRVFVESVLR